jgi:hypothetical protein
MKSETRDKNRDLDEAWESLVSRVKGELPGRGSGGASGRGAASDGKENGTKSPFKRVSGAIRKNAAVIILTFLITAVFLAGIIFFVIPKEKIFAAYSRRDNLIQDTVLALNALHNEESEKLWRQIQDTALALAALHDEESGNLRQQIQELELALNAREDSMDGQAGADAAGLRQENEKLKRQISAVLDGYNPKSKTFDFDKLIKSSTKQSVLRHKPLVGQNSEEAKVLEDLLVYFDAEELLAQPFAPQKNASARERLKRIKRQSQAVGALNDRISKFGTCNDALKKTIDELIKLDGREKAGGVSEIQKKKFSKISSIVGDYMSKNYEFVNYPFLSNTVFEIMQKKERDADRNIADLRKKL